MSYIECKNKNEYRFDDDLYIKDIKRCQCAEKAGDKYILDCKIIERGNHRYSYSPEDGFISRDSKKLWLGEKAKEKAASAVQAFEKAVSEAMGSYTKAAAPECNLTVFYKRNIKRNYDFVTLREMSSGSYIKLTTDSKVERMVNDIKSDLLRQEQDGSKRKAIEKMFDSDIDTIQNNPFYISAVQSNDELFKKQLRLYYNIASEEDCSWLTKFLGLKVLPSLPSEYNKNYIVDAGTINLSVLGRSGYKVLHRPYFAMINSTHDKWQLNPHTKRGVDAADVDAADMSFSEYLELFDEQTADGVKN